MVTIQDNGAPVATLSLNALGQASIASLSFSGGAHALQVKYAGDANYASAIASTSFIVQPAQLKLTLTCTPNPAASGEAVSCIFQLSDKTATGSVTFSDGAKSLGSANISAGMAILNIGKLGAGTYTVQASYSGDSNFMATQGASFAQTVFPTTQVIVVAAADGHPSLAPQAIGAASEQVSPTLLPPDRSTSQHTREGSMTITDSSGAQQAAPLFFVSPTQINFLTPNLARHSPGANKRYLGSLRVL